MVRRRRSTIDTRSTARLAAARSLFKRAGVAVDEADPFAWVVEQRWIFSAQTGAWRWPDGRSGGGGAGPLIAAIKSSAAPPEPANSGAAS